VNIVNTGWVVAARRQIAAFRTVADELERCLASGSDAHHSEAVGDQLIEEMARLGCRALEAASVAATSTSVSQHLVDTALVRAR
jgi:hypothetical protein